MDDTISLCCCFAGIAEDRIVQLQGSGIPFVDFRLVTTGCEKLDLKFVQSRAFGRRQFDLLAVEQSNDQGLVDGAGTQRIAFASSPSGERFRKPSDDNMLPL